MSLELIAEFDPFLSKNIADHGNMGRGKINYLSSTICEQFIALMADKVLTKILGEIMVNILLLLWTQRQMFHMLTN